MTCPACGGHAVSEIGFNYVACAETLILLVPQPWPLLPIEVSYLCATQYQIGVAMEIPQCACGTFAVGQCKECGAFVCGSHSALVELHRLCSADALRAQERLHPKEASLAGSPAERKAQREAQAQADLAELRARRRKNGA